MIWYLRDGGRVLGPYPDGRVREMLREGEIHPGWEASLDERDWLPLGETGLLGETPAAQGPDQDQDKLAWEAERQRARARWEDSDPDPAQAHDPGLDASRRQALERDETRTSQLLQAQQGRRPSLWIALAALMFLGLASVVVWWGQRDQPIRASLSQTANCAAPAAEGVHWSGCDLRGRALAGASLRNARLDRARLEDAHLAGAVLEYASARQANLRNADLRSAKLTAADLTQADLSGADLSGANLRHAALAGARLDGARLDGAIWSDGHPCAPGAIGACP